MTFIVSTQFAMYVLMHINVCHHLWWHVVVDLTYSKVAMTFTAITWLDLTCECGAVVYRYVVSLARQCPFNDVSDNMCAPEDFTKEDLLSVAEKRENEMIALCQSWTSIRDTECKGKSRKS